MKLSALVLGITPEQAFAAVADFRDLTAWDPAVKAVEVIEGEPMTVGALYELVGSALGGGLRLRYRIDSIQEPDSITYVGGTTNVTTTDTFRFDLVGPGTVVTVSSDMEFRGSTRWYGWAVRAGVYLGGRFVSLPALKRHLSSLRPEA